VVPATGTALNGIQNALPEPQLDALLLELPEDELLDELEELLELGGEKLPPEPPPQALSRVHNGTSIRSSWFATGLSEGCIRRCLPTRGYGGSVRSSA
jgi:hypothetical protein